MTTRQERRGPRRRWVLRLSLLALAAVAGAAFVLVLGADPREALRGQPHQLAEGQRRPAELAPVEGPRRPFFGVTTPSGPYNLAELEQFEQAAEKKPAVFMFSQDWTQGPVRTDLLDSIARRGMLPMITWEPRDHTSAAGTDQPQYALARIRDGSWDDYVRAWAMGLRDWRRPVAVRVAQQMNGSWFPWGSGVNGNQPGEYADAWRHLRRIFREVGASNVTWVWSPNISYTGSTPLADVYPGDDDVDWVGIDGYNGGSDLPWGGWLSADELFRPTIDEVRRLTTKPLMLTEVASTEAGGSKAAWIRDLATWVSASRDVVGFVWVEAEREADWRITSSPEASKAFATAVADFGPVPIPGP